MNGKCRERRVLGIDQIVIGETKFDVHQTTPFAAKSKAVF
jgi:hypothetical protein